MFSWQGAGAAITVRSDEGRSALSTRTIWHSREGAALTPCRKAGTSALEKGEAVSPRGSRPGWHTVGCRWCDLATGTRARAGLAGCWVVLALATSRRLTGAEPVARALDLTGPLILYDGAQTRTYPNQEILDERPLEPDLARTAVRTLVEQGLRPVVQYGDTRGEYLRVGPPAPRNPHAAAYLAQFAHQASVHPLEALCALDGAPLRVAVFGPWQRLRRAAAALAAFPCGVQVLRRGG